MTNSEIIQLYTAYEKEWEYRDSSFWNIYFKILFMEVTINLVPFIYKEYCADIIPLVIFPIVGLVLNFVFLYVLLSANSRYVAVGKSLKRINDLLDEQYRREEVKGIFSKRLLYFVIYTTFILMIILSIIIFIILVK